MFPRLFHKMSRRMPLLIGKKFYHESNPDQGVFLAVRPGMVGGAASCLAPSLHRRKDALGWHRYRRPRLRRFPPVPGAHLRRLNRAMDFESGASCPLLARTRAGSDEELQLTSRLISSLQAGISPLRGPRGGLRGSPARQALRARLRALLDSRETPADFLSSFLRAALDTGMPALASLQAMKMGPARETKARIEGGSRSPRTAARRP